jgi:hypothetical protein
MNKHEEDFQVWLDFMPEGLARFFDRLPPAVGDKLDYSAQSLDVLEAWLLDRYPDYEATRPRTESLVLDGAARYFGETFRKHLGGKWWIDPEGKIMGGRPLVKGFRSDQGSTCPLCDVTTAVDRRQGNSLSRLLQKRLDILLGEMERDPLLELPEMRKHIKVTDEEKHFRIWISMMDRGLSELFEELPHDVRDKLDYSAESLDSLEAWMIARYPTVQASRDAAAVLTMDGISRYVGEAFRRVLDGRWWFDFDGWSHNGLAEITGFCEPPISVCPLALARDAIDNAARRRSASPDANAADTPDAASAADAPDAVDAPQGAFLRAALDRLRARKIS